VLTLPRSVKRQFQSPSITSMFLSNRFIRGLSKFAAAITSILLSLGAFASPPLDILAETHAAVQAVMAVQEEVTPSLMEQPEILGTAVGLDNIAGAPLLTVYVDQEAGNVGEMIRNLPQEIRRVRVQIEPADEIRAMGYTARQSPPISLGTSGGWASTSHTGTAAAVPLGRLCELGVHSTF
jgi:hypothetical protein